MKKQDSISTPRKEASARYEKNKVESIRFRVKKGKRIQIQKCANKNNESVNAMLNRLVDNEIQKVLNK